MNGQIVGRIVPVEFNVVFKPDALESQSKGGIIIPKASLDRDQHAAVFGELIAISPLAFTYEAWPEGSRKPQVGDRVMIAKYSGTLVDPDKPDGLRVLKDKDVLAVIEA